MSEREIQSPMSGRNDSGQTKQPQMRAAGLPWRWQGMLQRVERQHQSFRCELRIMSGHSQCHKQTLLCSGKQPANSTSRFYYPPVTPVTQQFCNISLTPVHESWKTSVLSYVRYVSKVNKAVEEDEQTSAKIRHQQRVLQLKEPLQKISTSTLVSLSSTILLGSSKQAKHWPTRTSAWHWQQYVG